MFWYYSNLIFNINYYWLEFSYLSTKLQINQKKKFFSINWKVKTKKYFLDDNSYIK